MTQKTAMQELIEYNERLIDYLHDRVSDFTEQEMIGFFEGISTEAQKLLEKERQQIIDAYTDGQMSVIQTAEETLNISADIERDNEDGTEYYNQTYNQ